MDTMLRFGNDNLHKPITKEEMRKKAPYIFATGATNPAVSDRYVFASTETIIDDMAKLGWDVVDCKQQRANKRSNIRSFHMIAFQNPKVYISKANEDGTETIDCFPRIILTNSHVNKFAAIRRGCGIGLVYGNELSIAPRLSDCRVIPLNARLTARVICAAWREDILSEPGRRFVEFLRSAAK